MGWELEERKYGDDVAGAVKKALGKPEKPETSFERCWEENGVVLTAGTNFHPSNRDVLGDEG